MDDGSIRERLEELRTELERRAVRNPRSARPSASRATNNAALEDVDRALQMLDKGTYGLCEACGKPINPERLEANPAARFCREDQRLQER